MIRALFNRPFGTREEIDYIRASIATPKFCLTASCVLRAQLEYRDQTQSACQWVWENYVRELSGWATDNGVRLPTIPTECEQSYHMFYLVLPSPDHCQWLIWHLSQRQIFAVHYLPPHVSPMGLRFGGHQGDCPGTEDLADRLLHFSFFNGMRMAQTLATHFDGPVHVSNYPVHRALHKLGLRSSGARHCFHKCL